MRLCLLYKTTPSSFDDNDSFAYYGMWLLDSATVKSGKFGHQVNSDIRLQTVEIQMRRLLMSRLIRIFTVCLVNLFFIPTIELCN